MQDYYNKVSAFRPEAKRYLTGSFLLSVGSAVNDLLFNLHLKNLGYAESFIGSVISVQALGIVLFGIPAAFFVKKYSPRAMLMMSVSAAALLFALRALALDGGQIIGLSFLIGSVVSISRVIPAALLMRLSTDGDRAYLFGVNASVSMLGLVAGNFIGGQLPPLFINSFIFFNTALSGSALSNGTLSLDDAYRYSLVVGAILESTAVLAFARLPSAPVLRAPNETPFTILKDLREHLPTPKRFAVIWRVVYPHTIVGIGAGAVIPFIPLYLQERFGATSSEIGFYMSLVQSAVAMGYIFSPVIAERLGVVRSIVFVQFASLPFMGVMGFAGSITIVISAFIMRNVLMNMSGPFVEQYHMEAVPERDREMVSSIDITLWSLGWMVMSAISGVIIEHFSYQPLFIITMTLYAVSSVIYLQRIKPPATPSGLQPASSL